MRYESDICIIGGGITAAMLAQKLSELQPGAARRSSSRPAARSSTSRTARATASGCSTTARTRGPTTTSRISRPTGIISMTMAVGGLALHWGGACNRFSEEDLAAEVDVRPGRRLADRVDRARAVLLRGRAAAGVSRRAKPASGGSAVGAVPAAADAAVLQPADAEGVGREERHHVLGAAEGEQPDAVRRPPQLLRCDTCGDLSDRRALLARLHVQAAARAEEDRAARSHAGPPAGSRRRPARDRRAAQAVRVADRPEELSSTARRTFVVASGYCWSSHLLLLSASAVSQRPGEQLGPGRPLHERPRVHVRAQSSSTRRSIPGRT